MRNKEIVNLCKNFYKIINFDVFEGDHFTGKLIRIYKEYIFNIDLENKEDIDSVVALDNIIGKYIDDYIFRKEFQDAMLKIKVRKDSKNILKDVIKAIIRIFNNYEDSTTRVITISHWI